MYPFCDAALATELERLSVEEMRRFVATARAVDPYSEAAILEIAGGVAVYLGEGSPVNQAVGIGLQDKVQDEHISAIESFFTQRHQRGLLVLTPLADRSVFASLAHRGWTLDGFENVLINDLSSVDTLPASTEENGITIVVAEDEERRDLWAHLATIGFSAPLDPLPEQLALGRIVARRPGAVLLIALIDDRPAGTAEVYLQDGIAWLSADATLPQFRRRGVQQALQAKRLQMSAESGARLAVSEAIPGSGSQRNMERLGFRVAYTRVDMVAPMPA